jgi:hypothetical protein
MFYTLQSEAVTKREGKTQGKINNNNYDLCEVILTSVQCNGPPY